MLRRLYYSLAFRLVVSYGLVLLVGVATTGLLTWSLAGGVFDGHLQEMITAGSVGGTGEHVFELRELSRGFDESFRSAVLAAMVVGILVAVAVTAFAAARLISPIERIRRAARRLASGLYSERVPIPAEAELAALAKDVNALAEALENTEQRRLQLVGEVAHELRTPLTTIQGYMEALLDGVLQPDEEIFAATARETSRLQRVAEDLSTLSRAEEGRLEMARARVDLAAVAGEVAERLRPQFEASEVSLVVTGCRGLMVVGDADRLAQVFTNIIGNALGATPGGGKVEVTCSRVGGRAQVVVADTGRGIPSEMLDLVFERFFRIDRDAPGGTGIGLTIARRFARLHGGDVTAESEGAGRGSRFTVGIPLERRGVSGSNPSDRRR